jgi:dihydrofolate reductase
MARVIVQQSVSLDGYSAGHNTGLDHPLGEKGDLLHDWMFDPTVDVELNRELSSETLNVPGAFILGRTMFDAGIGLWDTGTFLAPCFVVTSRPHEAVVAKSGQFNFVVDGIEQALISAKAAAGDRPVMVMGGATVAQQFIKARLVDELRIALVPVLLGQGVRFFDHLGTDTANLEVIRVISATRATHLYYRFAK